jgi:hypothetical protein
VATLLAQIAPQRSTQYAELATTLAPHELRLSPLGSQIESIESVTLGRQPYLKLEISGDLDDRLRRELGTLAMSSAFFWHYDRLGEVEGPLLKPVDTLFEPLFPPDLMSSRRYKGKTSEIFTHFLCNVGRYSSAFAHQDWTKLRVFDPLMGGGTTLLTGLVLGAEVIGIEENEHEVEAIAAFLKQYVREEGIRCKISEERLKGLGKRWWFTMGKAIERRCVLVRGDTTQADVLLKGFKKPHIIVADLPYGVQHFGEFAETLAAALPVWKKVLEPGGTITLSWESTRFPRAQIVEMIHSVPELIVLDTPPYDQLAHQVDRVIKQRDVIVARFESANLL